MILGGEEVYEFAQNRWILEVKLDDDLLDKCMFKLNNKTTN